MSCLSCPFIVLQSSSYLSPFFFFQSRLPYFSFPSSSFPPSFPSLTAPDITPACLTRLSKDNYSSIVSIFISPPFGPNPAITVVPPLLSCPALSLPAPPRPASLSKLFFKATWLPCNAWRCLTWRDVHFQDNS